MSRINWHGLSILKETEAIDVETKCSNGNISKNYADLKKGSQNGFRMKKLWPFEEKLLKIPTKCVNVWK